MIKKKEKSNIKPQIHRLWSITDGSEHIGTRDITVLRLEYGLEDPSARCRVPSRNRQLSIDGKYSKTNVRSGR